MSLASGPSEPVRFPVEPQVYGAGGGGVSTHLTKSPLVSVAGAWAERRQKPRQTFLFTSWANGRSGVVHGGGSRIMKLKIF